MCHYADCRYAECHYAEFHYAVCPYAKCLYADRHYVECHYVKCRGAIFKARKVITKQGRAEKNPKLAFFYDAITLTAFSILAFDIKRLYFILVI